MRLLNSLNYDPGGSPAVGVELIELGAIRGYVELANAKYDHQGRDYVTVEWETGTALTGVTTPAPRGSARLLLVSLRVQNDTMGAVPVIVTGVAADHENINQSPGDPRTGNAMVDKCVGDEIATAPNPALRVRI